MENILEVKNLTKKYSSFVAVDDISFSLQEGEILGLLGVNGAGKTTTLQMLLGVLTPTTGSIHYFGKNLQKHREEILEQVNFSSTYTNLPWRLTVKECFTFISYLYDIKDRKNRIAKILELFKIEDLAKKTIGQLSAGQRTRVNLAKAFINYPKVLLLDEPTASLDPETAKFIREFLLEHRKDFHTSIIFTSHNMSEVEELCDRIVFIDKGNVVADDKPENLSRTIEVCHVSLLIEDGLKRIVQYCEDEKRNFVIDGRHIVIDVKEKEIPTFLKDLMDKGIVYTEISIEKPSLEDYFLEVAKNAYETT